MKVSHALLLLSLSACHDATASESGPRPPPREVWLSPAQASTLGEESVAASSVESTVRTSGKVAFDEARVAHVFSAATGRVTRIDAQLGQRVRKGEPLALVRSPDVGAATSDLAKARADLAASQLDFDRKRDLFAQHATSQADLEASEAAFRRSQAETARAKQRADVLDVGGKDVSSDFEVRSPIAGEVIAKTVSPGVEVQGQYSGGTTAELFTIGDIASVWLTADVYELDLPLVHEGATIRAQSVVYPGRAFTGTVDWVSKTIDPQTRVARMRCRFDNPDRALVPEMMLTVDIAVGAQTGIVIPSESVNRLGDESIVFVDRGDAPNAPGRRRFVATHVDVQTLVDGRSRVVKGLSENDRVVTKNSILLAGLL